MPVNTSTLTIEVARINGEDFAGVTAAIQLMDPMLAQAGNPTETVLPSTLTRTTDAQGVINIELIPSSIVGRYQVTLSAEGTDMYTKQFDMPASDARLSGLPDMTPEA